MKNIKRFIALFITIFLLAGCDIKSGEPPYSDVTLTFKNLSHNGSNYTGWVQIWSNLSAGENWGTESHPIVKIENGEPVRHTGWEGANLVTNSQLSGNARMNVDGSVTDFIWDLSKTEGPRKL